MPAWTVCQIGGWAEFDQTFSTAIGPKKRLICSTIASSSRGPGFEFCLWSSLQACRVWCWGNLEHIQNNCLNVCLVSAKENPSWSWYQKREIKTLGFDVSGNVTILTNQIAIISKALLRSTYQNLFLWRQFQKKTIIRPHLICFPYFER